MKTHYEILGVEATADADTIKKAFRREIARYHPDKVIHLGAEFQELAATRAAELTVAYKTLTDAAMRAQYDAGVGAWVPLPKTPAPAPRQETGAPPASAAPPAANDDVHPPAPPPDSQGRFAPERAGRDQILRRAIGARVHEAVAELYGKVETPVVRGFDLALVPLAKPRFMGAPPPRVLVKVVDTADAASMAEAWAAASRARIHSGKSPVVILLFARHIAPPRELTKANELNTRARKGPDAPEELALIVVSAADWSCRLPPGCSAAVRKLADQICS